MNRRILKSNILAGLLAAMTGCQAAPTQPSTAVGATVHPGIPFAVTGEAAKLFDQMAANYPALNVTVRRHGAVIWEHEGGTARGTNDGVASDYNFYSTAKMLTGLAFARLEQERGLDLSQSVRSIDPSLPPHYQAVTLRHLLTHTGGVRHYTDAAADDWTTFSARRCATPADAIGHFINDPLISPPGGQLHYSSYGFALLSHLLVKTTHARDYDSAMTRALGAAYTARTDRENVPKAQAYLKQDGSIAPMQRLSAECKFGAGGLVASARDLALFGEALYQGKIVKLDRVSELFTPTTADNPFAYGAVVRLADGVHVVGHSGGSPGGRSYLEVWIEPQVAVAITGNVEGPGLGELAASLARLFAIPRP